MISPFNFQFQKVYLTGRRSPKSQVLQQLRYYYSSVSNSSSMSQWWAGGRLIVNVVPAQKTRRMRGQRIKPFENHSCSSLIIPESVSKLSTKLWKSSCLDHADKKGDGFWIMISSMISVHTQLRRSIIMETKFWTKSSGNPISLLHSIFNSWWPRAWIGAGPTPPWGSPAASVLAQAVNRQPGHRREDS